MSWTRILPNATKSKHSDAVVVTATGKTNGRWRPRLSVVVRSAQIGPEAAWFAPGGCYHLDLGVGEHVGMIRLSEGGPHRIGTSGRHKVPMIQIIGHAWVDGAPKGSAACEHDSGEGWIEITLPKGIAALMTPTPAVPEAPASVPVAAKRGFSMTDHVMDPVTAGRRSSVAIR